MNSALLLGKLPAFSNRKTLIEQKQTVYDIMREVLTAHRLFSVDYDSIAADFWKGNIYSTCENLWRFCKRSIRYKVESEGNQTTKSPAAMLTQAIGDCKHYSGFIGGVLDALKRQGKNINWCYRFAAYNSWGRVPEHVFIVVKDKGREIWIDPVLKNFDEKLRPSYSTDKKINMLTRISGIGSTKQHHAISNLVESIDYKVSPQLYTAVQTLVKYGIMGVNAKVYPGRLSKYKKQPQLMQELTEAMAVVQRASIGSLFGDIFNVWKKVAFAPQRAAYLSIVGINGFGYATKLSAMIYKPGTTQYTSYQPRLYDIWVKGFGGDWSALRNTIDDGARKKAILGEAISFSAWVAAAATIIAAVGKVLTDAKNAGVAIPTTDLSTGLPYGTPNTSTNVLDWIKNNPVIIAGGLAAFYFISKNNRAA